MLSSSIASYNSFMTSAKQANAISTDKTKTAQVVRVGQKIAAATEAYLRATGLESDIKNFAWEFNLVKSNEMNAWCMPGGKIVVYEGLMKIVGSDDDLAVVLGHEVAHAVAKHSNERMSQQVEHKPAPRCWPVYSRVRPIKPRPSLNRSTDWAHNMA